MVILRKLKPEKTMETVKILSNSIVKDGVQGLILVKNASDFRTQKSIFVQDFNDRGRGDRIRLIGVPGGAIEKGESPEKAIRRELGEEISLNIREYSFKKFGCYTKLRPGGVTNNNHLFVIHLSCFEKRKTNDPNEVSNILDLSFGEIFYKARLGLVHEGSIRLILKFLKGERFGSLNEPVTFNGFTF